LNCLYRFSFKKYAVNFTIININQANMNMKIIRGTVFGGIAFFLLGWLVWGILLAETMKPMYDTTLNRAENEMIWWAMILSNLVFALLVTLALNWSGAKNLADGLKIGTLVGALYALSVDLGMFSMTTMINDMTGVVVDTLAYAVVTAVAGLVIVLTWGKEKTT